MATATLVVRRTLASSVTMNRSPGPIFSFAGKHTATTSTSAHVVRTRSLSRSPSSVRGRCRPGVSTRISWRVRAVHDAADHGARGLRLVGGDHDLLADQRVGQRRLAGVGAADERREAAAVTLGCIDRAPRRMRPRSPRRTCPPPCPPARSGPGRRRAAGGRRDGAPVAHHVVRRGRQPALPHQVLADRAHLRGLARHPEVARRRPASRWHSTTSASRLAPSTAASSQVTSAPSGR